MKWGSPVESVGLGTISLKGVFVFTRDLESEGGVTKRCTEH